MLNFLKGSTYFNLKFKYEVNKIMRIFIINNLFEIQQIEIKLNLLHKVKSYT